MPKKHDLQYNTYSVPVMTTKVSVKETNCVEPDLDTIKPWLFPAHKTVGQKVHTVLLVCIKRGVNYRLA